MAGKEWKTFSWDELVALKPAMGLTLEVTLKPRPKQCWRCGEDAHGKYKACLECLPLLINIIRGDG